MRKTLAFIAAVGGCAVLGAVAGAFLAPGASNAVITAFSTAIGGLIYSIIISRGKKPEAKPEPMTWAERQAAKKGGK